MKRRSTKKPKAPRKPAVARGLVFCRRLEKRLPEGEHLECPYCYGRLDDVRSTRHERFCDFQRGEDPIVFGFPATHGRHQHE